MRAVFIYFLASIGLLSKSFAEKIIVHTNSELKAAISKARPGDSILLTSGNWNDCSLTITCSGTADSPITICGDSKGRTSLTGNSQMQIGADYVKVSGLVFEKGYTKNGIPWVFKVGDRLANHCRVTNCMIDGFNPPDRMDDHYWISLYGKNNQIDHCSFYDKTNLGVLLAVILDDDRSRLNEHLITDNYFGIRRALGSNAGEIIRVGVSQHCTFYSNTKIFNNVFDNCDGEGEVISIKSCGNHMRGNIFNNCQGALVLRHGNDNLVEGNAFLGNGKEGTGGVRIINEGNWVINNFFSRCVGTGFRTPLTIMNGVPNSPPNRYLPVRDAVIMNNTFYDCSAFHVGEGADTERSQAPRNVFFLNNLFVNQKGNELSETYCETDSIYYINNQLAGKLNNKETGFFTAGIGIKKIGSLDFPVSSFANTMQDLPAFITKKLAKWKKGELSENIGAGNLEYFAGLIKLSVKKGSTIPRQIAIETRSPIIKCPDAAAVYAALDSKFYERRIELTGNKYVFDRSIKVNGILSINGNGKQQTIATANALKTVFLLTAFSEIRMDRLQWNCQGISADHFMLADTAGAGMHYKVKLSNAVFQQFKGNSFFEASLHSYSDDIEFSNTRFSSNKCILLNMGAEKEDKGYYSTETMRIRNCQFIDHQGPILIIYRGGNDESTMGPRIDLYTNRFSNCNSGQSLIQLSGVQYSLVANNSFLNCNPHGDILNYRDWVRARHYLKNNFYTGSGKVNTNKFLVSLQ